MYVVDKAALLISRFASGATRPVIPASGEFAALDSHLGANGDWMVGPRRGQAGTNCAGPRPIYLSIYC